MQIERHTMKGLKSCSLSLRHMKKKKTINKGNINTYIFWLNSLPNLVTFTNSGLNQTLIIPLHEVHMQDRGCKKHLNCSTKKQVTTHVEWQNLDQRRVLFPYIPFLFCESDHKENVKHDSMLTNYKHVQEWPIPFLRSSQIEFTSNYLQQKCQNYEVLPTSL